MPPVNDTKIIRALLDSVKAQICASAELVSEARRTTLDGLRQQFEAVIAKFSPEAATEPNAEQVQSLCSAITSFNSLFTLLNETLADARKNFATQLNSAVETEIKRRMDAGELIGKEAVAVRVQQEVSTLTSKGDLVPKETVNQLCATAKATGLTEGEAKVRTEVAAKEALATKVKERTATLQTAGLPIPEAEVEALLGGTDEVFNAHKARCEKQLGDFKSKGLQLNADNPLRAKAWLDEGKFKDFLGMADAIPALKRAGGELFAGGHTPPAPRFIV